MATGKSTKSPAFQFYPRDFLSSGSVDDMSMTERGIYITLLARCWMDDGLPTDMAALAKMARMKPSQFERIWSNSPLHKCFYVRSGFFRHERLDTEKQKQVDFHRRQSDNGKMGGRPPKEKAVVSSGLTQTEPKKSSASSSSSSTAVVPRTRPQPITSRRRLDAAWEFGLWYVPNRAHQDLLALHPEGFEPQLLAWYERVVAEWASGTRGNPGSDMIKFWKLRHDEAWPPAPPIARDAIGPVYTKVRQ